MERKRVIMTGGTGQLGSELKRLCRSDDQWYAYVFPRRHELDLSDLGSIIPALRDLQPDIIVHAGAYTAVDQAEEQPEWADRINHLATKEIARYCREHQVKLIYISTDYVFSGEKRSAWKEQDRAEPINIYGKTKWLGEVAALKENSQTMVIRTSWVYSSYGRNFVKTMLRLMQERPEVRVVDDQFGSPTYALDLAQAILHVLRTANWSPGIYHYSHTGRASWYEFAKAIQEQAGLDCRVVPVPSELFPTVARRPKSSVLDTSKIRSTFDLSIPSWRERLKDVLPHLEDPLSRSTKNT